MNGEYCITPFCKHQSFNEWGIKYCITTFCKHQSFLYLHTNTKTARQWLNLAYNPSGYLLVFWIAFIWESHYYLNIILYAFYFKCTAITVFVNSDSYG